MIDSLDFISIYIFGSLELVAGFYFFTGFLQKKAKLIHYILFAVFGIAVQEIFRLDGIPELIVFISFLMAAGRVLWKANCVLLALYAVLTSEIMNLCFGVINSLSFIMLPVYFEKSPKIFAFTIVVAGNVLALALSVLCYQVIQRCCACNEIIERKYAFMILMPALLIFLASEYINENIYGNAVTIEKNAGQSGVNPYQMLVIQTLGVVSLFCIMFTYKKLMESFRLNKEVALLEIQSHSLNQYVEEAKLRYEKTKSFRHDIKNHITVVKELLQDKKAEIALQYIEGMEDLTVDISFPVSTNNPVLDILLGNKLGIAQERQIEVQCSLLVPYPCGISDTDFCIILGNALDNAINACNRLSNDKQKYIHVTGKVQGVFLLMEIENSYNGRKTIHSGTGLENIRMAAEKYHGAMEIKTEGEIFVLSVLVIIPHQPDSISPQTG